MAAWQRIENDKWFDPSTKDFTSDDPIEIDVEALSMMGVTMRELAALLTPILGVPFKMDDMKSVIRVETKDNNYGR